MKNFTLTFLKRLLKFHLRVHLLQGALLCTIFIYSGSIAQTAQIWQKNTENILTDVAGSLVQVSNGNKEFIPLSIVTDKDHINDFHTIIPDFTVNPAFRTAVSCPERPTKISDKRFGGNNEDELIQILPTNDGGMLLFGSSRSPGSGTDKSSANRGNYDYWLVKIDANKNKVWDRAFGGTDSDKGTVIIPTSDGGYMIGGNSYSPADGDKSQDYLGGSDYWIVKIDANGIKIWDKRYGGTGEDELRSIIQTPDGGYLLAGSSNSPANGNKTKPNRNNSYDFWVLKINSIGERANDWVLGGDAEDMLTSIIVSPDGGYILGGHSLSFQSGDKTENPWGGSDLWIVKVNDNFNRIWDKTFGGQGEDRLSTNGILVASDGNYIIYGRSNSNANGDKTEPSWFNTIDYWILKVNSQNRSIIAQHRFGGGGEDGSNAILKTPDDGYILLGSSNSNATGDKTELSWFDTYDYWIVKVDANLEKKWDKRYGGAGDDFAFAISYTPQGNYIIGGFSNSNQTGDKDQPSRGSYDYWIVEFSEVPPPTITVSLTAICNGQTSTLTATNCLGTVTWSTGAMGETLVVSPSVTTSYTAVCTLLGHTGCSSTPTTITVCKPGSQSTFGYTAGSFSATDGGAATYGIPIVLPAGSAGVKPDLGLVYNSQGGNSFLGVGWSLAGIQVINRSSKTRAQDEAFEFSRNSAIGIDLSKEDRYSLNGSRLVLAPNSIQQGEVLNANYGRKGTEYYTEQNQFTRVSIPDTLSNGAPQYFLAYTKDGLVIEFGNSLESRLDSKEGVPITYLVNKISDRNGNYLRYYYDEQTEGTANSVYPYGKVNTYPLRIEYTANDAAAVTAYNRIEFEYIPRSDKQWSFIKGSYIGGGDKLISKIKISAKNAQGTFVEIRRYEMTYIQSKFTANSLLYQIRECADALCHEPTTFSWVNEDKLSSDLTYKQYNSTPGPFPAEAYSDINKIRLFGDWDGDGTTDLFVIDKNTAVYNYYLNRYPNSIPNGYNNFAQFPVTIFSLPVKVNFRTADFNADGKTDIIWWNSQTGDAYIIYSGFSGNTLQFSVKYANVFIPSNGSNSPNLHTQFFREREIEIVDWNNDGITDLVSIAKTNSYYTKGSDIWLQTQPPAYPDNAVIGQVIMNRQSISIPSSIGSQDYNRWQIADFNNDGLSDVCLLDTATSNISIYKMLSVKTADKVYDTDSTKFRVQDPTYGVNFESVPKRFNWSPVQNRFIPFNGQNTNFYNRPFFARDVNGDGLPDIAVKLSETTYQFQLSTGNFDFFEDVYTIKSTPSILGNNIISDLIDFNNDGNIDLLTYSKAGYLGSSIQLSGFDKSSMTFSNPLDNSLLDDLAVNFFFGNYSKTNLNELLFYKVNGTALTNRVYNNTLNKSDLIGTISEGSGQEIVITYKTLKDPSVYTRSSAPFRYPLFEFIVPIPVVASVRSKDGIGGYAYSDHYYEGAFSHSAGRGFRGFSKKITKDRQRNTYNINFYTIDANKWWLAGQPYRTEFRKDDPKNGQLLSLYEATFEAIPYSISTVSGAYMKSRSYYTYGKVSVARTYDLNTTNQISITTSRVTQDAYGNSTKVVVDHGDGVRDSTMSQYTDNVGSWLLGRLTRSTVNRFSTGKPISVRTAAFEYNAVTGQLNKEISDPDSSIQIKRETVFTHDAAGNIVQTEVRAWNGTQLESRISQFQFDNQKRLKLNITNPLGHQTFAAYDPASASLLVSTDINGLATAFQYDAFQRPDKVIDATGEETIEKFYRAGPTWNSPGNAKFVIYKKSGNAPAVIEHYDILGRLIRMDKINFSGNTISYTVTFNNKGEKTTETGPGVNTAYQYDLMSRVTRVTDYGLDNTYEYIGNQTAVTDIKGRKRIVEKNSQGQLLNSRWQSSNGLIDNHRIDYEYDGRNNPTRVAGNTNGFDVKNFYDARGYKVRMVDPVMGTYRYEYNGFGELLKQTDPKGNVVTMEYDKLGRVTKRTEPEGITTYVYDTGNKAKGKVSGINGFGGIVYAYTYDNYGRLATETKTINSTNYVTAYQYTADNKLDRIIYPSGLIIKHEYNAQDYLYIVRRVSDGKVLWRSKTANAVDNILTEDVYEKGTGQNAVLRHSYTYSSDLEHITQYQTSLPTDAGTPRMQEGLTYDNRYFINSQSETIYNGVGQVMRTGSTSYTYDDLDQLSSITPALSFPQIGQSENTAVNMTYDIYGNILTKSDVGNYNYDQNALGGTRYLTRVDLINPAVCIPSFKITTDYTSFNKVKKISNDSSYAVITYGPDHARVMQQLFVNNKLTKTKIYVNGLYELEISGGKTRETSYIRGGNGVVAAEMKVASARTVQLWVKDHANNLVAVVDTNGNVLEHLRYDVWGRRLNADKPGAVADSSSHLTDRGFTKHEHLDLFLLINMNGRIYDPVIARFISPDPFIDNALDLQAYNRYAYVQNNPIMFTDPSGYWKIKNVFKAVSNVVNKVANIVTKVEMKNPFTKLALKATYESAKVLAKVMDSKVMPSTVRDHWRPVLTTAASVVVGAVVFAYTGSVEASGAAAGFTSGFLGTTWAGGSLNDATNAGVKGAIYGAMTAYLTSGVGDLAGKSGTVQHVAVKTVGHATVQGGMAETQGGNFWDGAKVGAFSGATGDLVMRVGEDDFSSKLLRTSIAATLGGTTSALSGGKFSNGAMSGAFVHLFNDEGHPDSPRKASDEISTKVSEIPGELAMDEIVKRGMREGAATRPPMTSIRPYINVPKIIGRLNLIFSIFFDAVEIDPDRTMDRPNSHQPKAETDGYPINILP